MYESAVEAIVRDLEARRLNTPLVAIDGPGGSGKSTLARELARRLGGSVVEADDFYLPSSERDAGIGGEYDWRRLETQVLVPLTQGRGANYQRYDWATDRLAESREVSARHAVVLEGVYLLRTELVGYYDYRVWIEADREVRLRRGLDRDGERARQRWMEWMRREDAYMAAHCPADVADRRIAGAP